MLKYNSFKPFDSWYDAGMNYAQFAVKVWINSKHFTLTDYDGKEEFYDLASDTVERFSRELTDTDDIQLQLDTFRLAVATSTLTFRLLTKVCMILMFYMDVHNKVKYTESVDDYTSSIYNKHIYDSIVPLLTPTGIFGMNTYLYLMYHGLYPVSCSITPIPVHYNYFHTGYLVLHHDIDHNFDIVTSLGEQYHTFRKIYQSLNTFNDQDRKLIVLTLFIFIHERGGCLSFVITKDNWDKVFDDASVGKEFIPQILKLDRYSNIVMKNPELNWKFLKNGEHHDGLLEIMAGDAVKLYQHLL